MMNLKKGNQVKIISGKDRGKTGEIISKGKNFPSERRKSFCL